MGLSYIVGNILTILLCKSTNTQFVRKKWLIQISARCSLNIILTTFVTKVQYLIDRKSVVKENVLEADTAGGLVVVREEIVMTGVWIYFQGKDGLVKNISRKG